MLFIISGADVKQYSVFPKDE